jgi:hypothetical protein
MTKHLGINMKRQEVLLCFDYQNGITYEEKKRMFTCELELFSIGTINLLLEPTSLVVINPIQIEKVIGIVDYGVNTKINHITIIKTIVNKELKTTFENKVCPKTYYHYIPCQIQIDETPTNIKMQ